MNNYKRKQTSLTPVEVIEEDQGSKKEANEIFLIDGKGPARLKGKEAESCTIFSL